jgi:hypothetical protein
MRRRCPECSSCTGGSGRIDRRNASGCGSIAGRRGTGAGRRRVARGRFRTESGWHFEETGGRVEGTEQSVDLATEILIASAGAIEKRLSLARRRDLGSLVEDGFRSGTALFVRHGCELRLRLFSRKWPRWELDIHHELLKVGPPAERVKVGIALHPHHVAVTSGDRSPKHDHGRIERGRPLGLG